MGTQYVRPAPTPLFNLPPSVTALKLGQEHLFGSAPNKIARLKDAWLSVLAGIGNELISKQFLQQ